MLSGDIRARLTVEQLKIYQPCLPRALVLVRIEAIGRGIPTPCAILYAPKHKDDLARPNLEWSSVTPNSRLILGYVRTGDFNHSVGRGTGLGFISLAALVIAMHESGTASLPRGLGRVLMKNPRTTRLRPVDINVVL
ncbi:unnamed protein product [Dicrocoelium dendriticum]|nr:unnamed protein product [Dicrocoelium dendriticum]